MKKLIIYYSLDGSTKFIAERIAEKKTADLLELKLKTHNLSGKNKFSKFFWGGRQVLIKQKPELDEFDKDPMDYDAVFIGTPVWVGTYSPALRAFFNKVKLKGKKVFLFCSYGGIESKTFVEMKKQLEENEIIDQFSIKEPIKNQSESLVIIDAWLDSIKI